MKRMENSIVLKEYFDVISPLLAYEDCPAVSETERKTLSFLCQVMGCEELYDGCLLLVEGAKCLQSSADTALLTSDFECENAALDVKTEVLKSAGIDKVRKYNEALFVRELKSKAVFGDKSACRLLAVMYRLGISVEENARAAQNIWSSLAVSGDMLSFDMLIFCHKSAKNDEESRRWTHIKEIILSENESFSAIAQYSNYPGYTEDEVDTANIIMFVSQTQAKHGVKLLDRPLTHYVLNSKDDYKKKMTKLSSDTNYYLAMYLEEKYTDKEYGF